MYFSNSAKAMILVAGTALIPVVGFAHDDRDDDRDRGRFRCANKQVKVE